MAVLPRKPQAGDRAMQSMYDAICNIIDFLPSLEIRGDNRTIKIDSFASGKTISAVPQTSSANNSDGSIGNWPKLAKIIGKTDNIYVIRFVDINGAFITEDDENYVYASDKHCLIPGLSLYSDIPIGTLILVSPVTTYALEGDL